MVAKRIMVVTMVAMVAMALAACGKQPEAPAKTPEQAQAEKDAATKAVRDNPVYGGQFKALDKAKETAAAADEAAKNTNDALKKLDEPK